MKKIAVALVALAAVMGFVGCTNPTSSTTTPTTTLSNWQIKGSQDGWTLHQFTVDPLTSTKLTYTMSTPYKTTYQFVLVGVTSSGAIGADPANKFDTASTTVVANNGTAFAMVPTASGGKNVMFHADYTTYTVTVDISNPASPSVKLVAGTTAATAVTAAVLAQNLQIKGNQFSKIDGNTVAAWTATNPQTANLNTSTGVVSWDVYVDNYVGTFGFNSNIDGWVAGTSSSKTIDVTSLTSSTSTPTTAIALDNTTSGSGISLTNMPMSGSVYTITVACSTPSQAYGPGSYTISVALKTLSTTNWVFSPWTQVYITGGDTNLGSNGWTNAPITVSSGVATYQYTAAQTSQTFDINTTNAWTNQYGFAQVDTTGSAVTLSAGGGYGTDIAFTAVVNQKYTIKVDFTTTSYTQHGKPTVTVTTP